MHAKTNWLSSEARQAHGEKYDFTSPSLNIPLPKDLRVQISDYFLEGEPPRYSCRADLEKLAAAYLSDKTGVACNADLVCFGLDFRDLIFFLQTHPEMHVALVTPVDKKYLNVALGSGNLSHIDTQAAGNWRLMPSDFEKWCRTRSNDGKQSVVYLPHSPSGAVYRMADLKGLAEAAAKHSMIFLRQEFPVTLSDKNLRDFYPEGTLLFVNPFHNTTASSWGLGFAVFPASMRALCDGLRGHLRSLGREITDLAMLSSRYFFTREPDVLEEKRLGELSTMLRLEVREILQGSEISFSLPEEGFSLFLDLEAYRTRFGRKEIYGAAEMCKRIAESTGIRLVPGTELGCSSSALLAALRMHNINMKTTLDAAVTQPINTSFLYKHCWDTIEGVQKLVRYLGKL